MVASNETIQQEIAQMRAMLSSLQSELKTTQIERDYFKAKFHAQVQQLFAARSEARHNAQQKDLFLNEAELLAEPVVAAKPETVNVAAHQKAKPGRKPLDPNLPREIVRIELPEHERVCSHDKTPLKEMGVEVSEQLDIVPAQIKVIRTERVKYACPCCEQNVKTATAPKQLIQKGLFTPNAIAWIVVSKYQDALPLYRQATMLNRVGGDVARNTLATLCVRVGEAVQPIINLLQDHWLNATIKHIDETVVQVLKENGKAAQSKSYFWLRACDDGPPVRLFTYAPTRGGNTALELTEGARGALMSDGYDAYNKAAALRQLTHLGCWVHARRYFIKAEEALPKTERGKNHPTTRMIKLIGKLYAIEQEGNEKQLKPEQRTTLRQEKSVAIIEDIEKLKNELIANTAPKSVLGEALIYLHNQWHKLIRFTDNGAWPLDNNIAENAIRPFVIGRKNWLFSDTVNGANASANLYTLIETAKANGIEPYHYLAHLFHELPKAETVVAIEALLPWNVKFALGEIKS